MNSSSSVTAYSSECYEINHMTKFIFLITGKLLFQKGFGNITALDLEPSVMLFIYQKTEDRSKV